MGKRILVGEPEFATIMATETMSSENFFPGLTENPCKRTISASVESVPAQDRSEIARKRLKRAVRRVMGDIQNFSNSRPLDEIDSEKKHPDELVVEVEDTAEAASTSDDAAADPASAEDSTSPSPKILESSPNTRSRSRLGVFSRLWGDASRKSSLKHSSTSEDLHDPAVFPASKGKKYHNSTFETKSLSMTSPSKDRQVYARLWSDAQKSLQRTVKS